jgi:hypothetical protein
MRCKLACLPACACTACTACPLVLSRQPLTAGRHTITLKTLVYANFIWLGLVGEDPATAAASAQHSAQAQGGWLQGANWPARPWGAYAGAGAGAGGNGAAMPMAMMTSRSASAGAGAGGGGADVGAGAAGGSPGGQRYGRSHAAEPLRLPPSLPAGAHHPACLRHMLP